MLFYKSRGPAEPPHKKKGWGSQQPPAHRFRRLCSQRLHPLSKKKKNDKRFVSWPFFFQLRYAQVASRQFEINVFFSISSSSSTVHRFFVVFPHLLWLSRYSFIGDKLSFTNTGKFFVGAVTWLVWISFNDKFFYLVVLCLCSFPTEALIFTFGLEHWRTTNKKIRFIVCPGKISALTKPGSDHRTGSSVGPDHRTGSSARITEKKKKHKKIIILIKRILIFNQQS